MPNYVSNGQATLLHYNEQKFLWNNEAVVATQLSISYQIQRIDGGFYPWGFSVEIQFSGAPGAFEFDIMGADIDASGNYVKLGSITTVNASNVGRFDTVAFYPKYVSGYLASIANTVSLTARVTR